MNTQEPRTYCQAATNSQMFGSSWASSTWGCGRYATKTVNGKALCWQHARMEEARLESRAVKEKS